MDTKTQIYLTSVVAVFFAGGAWMNYEWLPPHVWGGLACLLAFKFVVFTANHYFSMRAIRNAVKLEIRPNQLVVNGIELHLPFSSQSHLFSSRANMLALVDRAADNYLEQSGHRVVLKPSAQVTIWPCGIQVTDVEVEALAHSLSEFFREPAITVINGQANQPSIVTRAA